MILQILTSNALEILKDKVCIEKYLNKYKNDASSDWVMDVCGENPFQNTKYKDIPQIEFDTSAPKGKEFETEFENVKRVYSTLSFLSDSNASEERLWAALCLGIGYKYVQYRWKTDTVTNIAQHFFFENGNRRSLTRNALSRLWWIGRLTYDKDRDDPYELTKLVCAHSDHVMHFIERNTSNNIHILRPFLEAIIEAQEEGYDLNTDDAGELSKYLNLLGGMYILDFMPEEWIKGKISTKIEHIVKRSIIDSSELTEESKKWVKSNSKVVLQSEKTGKKLIILARKNKFRTIPQSLVNLTVDNKVKIGKISYRIIDIR